jgi:hypothetical protein
MKTMPRQILNGHHYATLLVYSYLFPFPNEIRLRESKRRKRPLPRQSMHKHLTLQYIPVIVRRPPKAGPTILLQCPVLVRLHRAEHQVPLVPVTQSQTRYPHAPQLLETYMVQCNLDELVRRVSCKVKSRRDLAFFGELKVIHLGGD